MAIVLSILKCNSRTIGPSPRGGGGPGAAGSPPPLKKIRHYASYRSSMMLSRKARSDRFRRSMCTVLISQYLPTACCSNYHNQLQTVSRVPHSGVMLPDIGQTAPNVSKIVVQTASDSNVYIRYFSGKNPPYTSRSEAQFACPEFYATINLKKRKMPTQIQSIYFFSFATQCRWFLSPKRPPLRTNNRHTLQSWRKPRFKNGF